MPEHNKASFLDIAHVYREKDNNATILRCEPTIQAEALLGLTALTFRRNDKDGHEGRPDYVIELTTPRGPLQIGGLWKSTGDRRGASRMSGKVDKYLCPWLGWPVPTSLLLFDPREGDEVDWTYRLTVVIDHASSTAAANGNNDFEDDEDDPFADEE